MSDATVHSAIRAVSGALLAAGIDEGRREARLLVAEVTGHDAARLLAYPEKVLTPAMLGDLDRMVARRAAREPLSRILGWREFYGRRFQIDPAVLDPRPDTETLVDIVLELMAGRGAGAPPCRLLDIGIGSGALLVTLLAELPDARGVGIDVSPGALAIAQCNAGTLGVADRMTLIEADVLTAEGVAMLADGAFDVIVSNPPYIRTADLASLAPEVRLHDPGVALDGGDDGLVFYRRFAGLARRLIAPDGWLVLEVGYDQATAVSALVAGLSAAGSPPPQVRRDLAGHARCVAQQIQSTI